MMCIPVHNLRDPAMTILIADDHAPWRESVKQFLSRHIAEEHRFVDASNGVEAVTLFASHRPDLTLMDIEMEPMDGLTALRLIRSVHPAARIIIVTSYDEPAYRTAAGREGAAGYILKERFPEVIEIIRAQQ